MDVENNAVAPKRLELTPVEEIQIVNPNLDHIHRDTIGGHNFTFEPMIIYQVSAEKGGFLVDRAEDLYQNQKHSARAEMHNYLSVVESPEPQRRALAKVFCTVNEDGEPVPRSQPPPKPGLVRLDNVEGKRLYQESLDELKAKTKAAPRLIDPIVEELQPEQTEQPEHITLVSPDINWSNELKIQYIKEFAPRKRIYTKYTTNPNGLNKQLFDSFNDRKKSFEDLGINYKISTEYKPNKGG